MKLVSFTGWPRVKTDLSAMINYKINTAVTKRRYWWKTKVNTFREYCTFIWCFSVTKHGFCPAEHPVSCRRTVQDMGNYREKIAREICIGGFQARSSFNELFEEACLVDRKLRLFQSIREHIKCAIIFVSLSVREIKNVIHQSIEKEVFNPILLLKQAIH